MVRKECALYSKAVVTSCDREIVCLDCELELLVRFIHVVWIIDYRLWSMKYRYMG